MCEDIEQLEATFFDAQKTTEGPRVRRGGAQKLKLQAEIQREEARIATAEKRIAVLRRAARGNYRDRAIYIDASWETQGRKVRGAALAVFQDKVICYPAAHAYPHELYGRALVLAWGKVLKETGGDEGLTINFAKAADPETMRLLTDPGGWGNHYNSNGENTAELTMWMCLSGGFRSGAVRFRAAPLPEPNADRLAYMAGRARHLSGSLDGLPREAFDRIFNEPLRQSPPAWF